MSAEKSFQRSAQVLTFKLKMTNVFLWNNNHNWPQLIFFPREKLNKYSSTKGFNISGFC